MVARLVEMADGSSPLHFPSPRTILGEDTSPPPPLPAEQPARRSKHARSSSKKDNNNNVMKKAVPKKGAAAEADVGPDTVKGAKVDKPKQTKSRNGNC